MKTKFVTILCLLALTLFPGTGLCKEGCVNGLCKWQGTYVWDNGNRYEGEFKNYDLTGKGTLTFSNGEVYVGEFKSWEMHGHGVYTMSDGDVFEGEFGNSDMVKGTYKYANGDTYQGEFKDWQMNGQGTYTHADGTVQSGTWKNNQYVGGDASQDKSSTQPRLAQAQPAAEPPTAQTQTEPRKAETLSAPMLAKGLVADHKVVGQFSAIPEQSIKKAIESLKIYYGHTSHGSQLVDGMRMLQSPVYDFRSLRLEETDGDLGHKGDLDWAEETRDRLGKDGNGINLVVWSWCGGVSDNNSRGIDKYLEAMDELEKDYPKIAFVYMTGHLDKRAASTLKKNNQRIRDWCVKNNKILFDFADIESYDPSGKYQANASDACEWCKQWCKTHECPPCEHCAHSHCFNCYMKGKAFWWLLSRLVEK